MAGEVSQLFGLTASMARVYVPYMVQANWLARCSLGSGTTNSAIPMLTSVQPPLWVFWGSTCADVRLTLHDLALVN